MKWLGILAFAEHALATTIFLCGDSTMANPVTKGTTQELARVGWGAVFASKMSITVVNLAQIGASVRSFTNAGFFDQIVDAIGEGDWMICQFGHNELGGYHSSDKAALPGIGPETLEITNLAGNKEVLRTYGGYLSKVIARVQSKGAQVMLFSQTPEMQYTALSAVPLVPTRFVQFAHDLAQSLQGVVYYDHYQSFSDYLLLCGARKSSSFFLDNRHMNKVGAKHAAELVVQWLRESDSALRGFIIGDTGGLESQNSKRSYHMSGASTRGHRKKRLSQ